MTIELTTLRKPCSLYSTCPYETQRTGDQGSINDILPNQPPCGNCAEEAVSTPDTQPGEWKKLID